MFLVIFVLFYFTYAHAFFFAYTRAFTQAHTNRLQNYKKKLTYTRVYAIFCRKKQFLCHKIWIIEKKAVSLQKILETGDFFISQRSVGVQFSG